MGSPDRVSVDPDPGRTVCSVWSRHGLGGTHPVLGPWSTAQPAPVGFPRLVRALGPKELIKPSGNSPLTGQCGPRAHGTPAGRAWAQGFLRMLAVRARPTADTPGGLGCPPHTPSCHDWSPARPRMVRPRARLPTADNLARGPAAGARPPARVPCHQNIPAARLRPARGAPSPVTRRELTQVSADAPGQVRPRP